MVPQATAASSSVPSNESPGSDFIEPPDCQLGMTRQAFSRRGQVIGGGQPRRAGRYAPHSQDSHGSRKLSKGSGVSPATLASSEPANPANREPANGYLMIRRFDGAVGGAGAVPAAWLTPIVMPPTLNSPSRDRPCW